MALFDLVDKEYNKDWEELWEKACWFDNYDPKSVPPPFSESNPYQDLTVEEYREYRREH